MINSLKSSFIFTGIIWTLITGIGMEVYIQFIPSTMNLISYKHFHPFWRGNKLNISSLWEYPNPSAASTVWFFWVNCFLESGLKWMTGISISWTLQDHLSLAISPRKCRASRSSLRRLCPIWRNLNCCLIPLNRQRQEWIFKSIPFMPPSTASTKKL